MMTIEQMRELVDKTLRDEADFEETMNLLDASIAAAPNEPEFLRMRIELLEAAYIQVPAWQARKNLLAMLPDDLSNHLAVLTRQHRFANWIADDYFSARMQAIAPEEEGDTAENVEPSGHSSITPDIAEKTDAERMRDEECEAALAAIQAESETYVAQLQSEAIDGFLRLMQTHAGDAIAVHQILDAWNDSIIWSPWKYYTMLLLARAAHPHDARFKKDVAKFLVSICEASEEDADKAPTGYFDHMISGRFHALTVYQALAAIDAVDSLGDDPELLTQKAHLLLALDDYTGAGATLRQAAQAYEKVLKTASEEERADLQTRLDDALQEAAACDGGRAGVYAAHFAKLDAAIASLHDMPSRFPRSPDAPDYLSEPIQVAESAVSEWKTAARTDPTEPTAAELESLDAAAAKNAHATMSLVKWDYIELCAMDREAFQQEITSWFDDMAAELGATDMQLHGWFQNLGNVAALGREAPGQYWLSPKQEAALTLEAANKIRLKRCLTEFNDGSLMLTADARGSSYFVNGPYVHTFSVFKSTPVTELLALHQARVAAQLAAIPGLKVKPMASLSSIEELENNLRTHSREFRLANGITDPEIRGMNVKFNDYYAKQLKREVAERIAVMKGAGR